MGAGVGAATAPLPAAQRVTFAQRAALTGAIEAAAVDARQRLGRTTAATTRAGRAAQVPREPRGIFGGDFDRDGFGRYWAMSIGSQAVRQTSEAIRAAADATVQVTSDIQNARAELRAVIGPEHSLPGMNRQETLDAIYRRAELSARGMTPTTQRLAVTEHEYTEAVRLLAASGFKGPDLIALTDVSIPAGIAFETSQREAANFLSIASTRFLNRDLINQAPAYMRTDIATKEFMRLADVMAKAQDTFRTPEGFGPMGAAMVRAMPFAGGYDFEQFMTAIGIMLDSGLPGARAGFKAMHVLRDLPTAFDKLGIRMPRLESGAYDLHRALSMLDEGGFGDKKLVKAFGKTTASGVTTMLQGLDKMLVGLGDTTGTALENAEEHFANLRISQQRLAASSAVLQHRLGRGSTAVRQFGIEIGVTATRTLNSLAETVPGFAAIAGGALEVGNVTTRVASGMLDTAIGVNAAFQLWQGLKFSPGRIGRTFSAIDRGLSTTRAGFAGMFGFQGAALPMVRAGWASVFTTISAGLARLQAQAGGFVAGGVKPGARPPPTGTGRTMMMSSAAGFAAGGYGAPGLQGSLRADVMNPARQTQAARFGAGRPTGGIMMTVAALTALNWHLADQTGLNDAIKTGLGKAMGWLTGPGATFNPETNRIDFEGDSEWRNPFAWMQFFTRGPAPEQVPEPLTQPPPPEMGEPETKVAGPPTQAEYLSELAKRNYDADATRRQGDVDALQRLQAAQGQPVSQPPPEPVPAPVDQPEPEPVPPPAEPAGTLVKLPPQPVPTPAPVAAPEPVPPPAEPSTLPPTLPPAPTFTPAPVDEGLTPLRRPFQLAGATTKAVGEGVKWGARTAWEGLKWGVGAMGNALGFGSRKAGEDLGSQTELMLRENVQPLMAQSDAERGPLANLTYWGSMIPRTLAAGVLQGAPVLQESIASMLAIAVTPPKAEPLPAPVLSEREPLLPAIPPEPPPPEAAPPLSIPPAPGRETGAEPLPGREAPGSGFGPATASLGGGFGDFSELVAALTANTRALNRLARAAEEQQREEDRKIRNNPNRQGVPDPRRLDLGYALSGLEAIPE